MKDEKRIYRTLDKQRWEKQKCRSCNGHGADPMSDNVNWLPCRQCGGSGIKLGAKNETYP